MQLNYFKSIYIFYYQFYFNLDSLKKEIPEIEIIQLDVTDWNKTEHVLKDIGPIDLVVNNAGMGWLKSMMDIVEEDFDR